MKGTCRYILTMFFIALSTILILMPHHDEQSVLAEEIKAGSYTEPGCIISENGTKLVLTFSNGYTETHQNGVCFVDGTILHPGITDEWNEDFMDIYSDWVSEHSLNEIMFSSEVTEIYNGFQSEYYSNVQKITLGCSVEVIGDYCFLCSQAENIIFSDVLKKIGKNAFYGCENIQAIVLPETLEAISDGAFLDCNSLIDITVLSKDVILEEYCLGFSNRLQPLENVTIRGYQGSTIETYAHENGFTFIPLENATTETTAPNETTITTTSTSPSTSMSDYTTAATTTAVMETTDFSTISNTSSTTVSTEITLITTTTTLTTVATDGYTTSWSTLSTSVSSTTTDTIISDNTVDELPQTGYPKIYNAIAGLAAFMIVTGTAIIVKAKK